MPIFLRSPGLIGPLEYTRLSIYNRGICLLEASHDVFPLTRILDTPMAGGKRKKKLETVFLVCEESGDHNYTLRRKVGAEKLKLKKYSPRLRKHTLHTEKKK